MAILNYLKIKLFRSPRITREQAISIARTYLILQDEFYKDKELQADSRIGYWLVLRPIVGKTPRIKIDKYTGEIVK